MTLHLAIHRVCDSKEGEREFSLFLSLSEILFLRERFTSSNFDGNVLQNTIFQKILKKRVKFEKELEELKELKELKENVTKKKLTDE